jgi:hypothetical protein
VYNSSELVLKNLRHDYLCDLCDLSVTVRFCCFEDFVEQQGHSRVSFQMVFFVEDVLGERGDGRRQGLYHDARSKA